MIGWIIIIFFFNIIFLYFIHVTELKKYKKNKENIFLFQLLMLIIYLLYLDKSYFLDLDIKKYIPEIFYEVSILKKLKQLLNR